MQSNRCLNITIISSHQFPYGGAQTNRIICYAKGLNELGHNVHILISTPYCSINDMKIIGEIPDKYNELKYIYFTKIKNSYYNNSIIKAGLSLISIIKILKFIELKQYRKNNSIFVIQDNFLLNRCILLLYLKSKSFVISRDISEYPQYIINNELNILKKIISKLNFWIENKFDALFTITDALKKFYSVNGRNKVQIFVLNMLVEPSRFERSNMTEIEEPAYIAYCGSMEGNKDGVETLIRAFGLALKGIPSSAQLYLKLIGDVSNEKLLEKLKCIALEARCIDRIIFTGLVDRENVPILLSNAKALALARPGNKQAEGGFPTKLGEYLATGNPVILTNVGEISIFMTDGQNAFVAEPDNITSFSDKIIEVFSDYANAKRIGEEGRKLIYTAFNYKKQSIALFEFMSKVLAEKFTK